MSSATAKISRIHWDETQRQQLYSIYLNNVEKGMTGIEALKKAQMILSPALRRRINHGVVQKFIRRSDYLEPLPVDPLLAPKPRINRVIVAPVTSRDRTLVVTDTDGNVVFQATGNYTITVS